MCLYFSRWKAAISRRSATNSFRLHDSVLAAIKTPSPARIDRPRAQHFHRERAWGEGGSSGKSCGKNDNERAERHTWRGVGERERIALPPRRSRIYHSDISKCRAVYQVFPGENLKVPWHELAAHRHGVAVREYEHRIDYVIKFT